MLHLTLQLLTGYEILVILVVLGSWLPGALARRWLPWLRKGVEPLLVRLRGALPVRGGVVDFSPYLLMFLLEVVRHSLSRWNG